MFKTAQQTIRESARRILVIGASGTGKTAFSVSASKHAGDTLPLKEPVECSDVAMIQGDMEGVQGALDAGLRPGKVLDLSGIANWELYKKAVTQALGILKPLVAAGEIKYCVVDLSLPARLIELDVNPQATKDWKEVLIRGGQLFDLFKGIPALTIIGNAQIKAASSPNESTQAEAAANAKAVGGERATYTIDLHKGIKALWVEHNSLMFCREARKGRDGVEYFTHTQAGRKFEAKSRFHSKLGAVEPGNLTMHNLLTRAYGEDL